MRDLSAPSLSYLDYYNMLATISEGEYIILTVILHRIMK